MTIRAQIAHSMPGRLRIRLPELRGNAEVFAQLEDLLLESRLVHGVRVNPVTASVTLEFDGQQEALLEALRTRLPFALDLSPAPGPAHIRPSASFQPDPVRLVSGRDINAMFLAGTLFIGVGLVQALRGRIMLPALSAFWYANDAFRRARTQKGEQMTQQASAPSG